MTDLIVKAMARAMHADDVEHGRAFLTLPEMDPTARQSYYDNAQAALTVARPLIAAEIRDAVDDMGDPDPVWRLGILHAARIVERAHNPQPSPIGPESGPRATNTLPGSKDAPPTMSGRETGTEGRT